MATFKIINCIDLVPNLSAKITACGYVFIPTESSELFTIGSFSGVPLASIDGKTGLINAKANLDGARAARFLATKLDLILQSSFKATFIKTGEDDIVNYKVNFIEEFENEFQVGSNPVAAGLYNIEA
jgi:hypothetical protein